MKGCILQYYEIRDRQHSKPAGKSARRNAYDQGQSTGNIFIVLFEMLPLM